MAGYEAALTSSLRDRGDLPPGAKLLAAWSGYLLQLRGADNQPDASDPYVVTFGITTRTGHVMSRLGVFSFNLTQVRGPHSPYPGLLRFTVVQDHAPNVDVGIAVRGAVAIAAQLADAAQRAAGASPDPDPRHRPPAKQRADSTDQR